MTDKEKRCEKDLVLIKDCDLAITDKSQQQLCLSKDESPDPPNPPNKMAGL